MKSSTEFEIQVYEALKLIPKGRVATYGEMARFLNKPRGARAVGNALNRNPHAPRIPCHRVVGSDGSLKGYAFGLKKKVELLEKEGVSVQKGKIDLETFGYHFI